MAIWSLTFDRQPGQGGGEDSAHRDLRAELLAAEAAHFAKKDGVSTLGTTPRPIKRELEAPEADETLAEEDFETKRRRILEESRDIDADSEGEGSDSSDEDSDDDEDETAELMRELEKIKRERAEAKAKEVSAPSDLLCR